jgi:hypothetical protein
MYVCGGGYLHTPLYKYVKRALLFLVLTYCSLSQSYHGRRIITKGVEVWRWGKVHKIIFLDRYDL